MVEYVNGTKEIEKAYEEYCATIKDGDTITPYSYFVAGWNAAKVAAIKEVNGADNSNGSLKFFEIDNHIYGIRVRRDINYIAKDCNGDVCGYAMEPCIDEEDDDTIWMLNEYDYTIPEYYGVIPQSIFRDINWKDSLVKLSTEPNKDRAEYVKNNNIYTCTSCGKRFEYQALRNKSMLLCDECRDEW